MSSVNPFRPADFLIPKDADLSKWSVIACDQYTSDPEYWARVRETVGSAPSTLNLILPEAELEGADTDERASQIRHKYSEYLGGGLLAEHKNCYIYIERTLKNGKLRCGLLGAVDLEAYEPSRYAETLIRPSEETVFERVPPRVKIRSGCKGEVNHLVMFVDDDKKKLIEPLSDLKASFVKLYDFDLMENGGHICGWKIPETEAKRIDSALAAMADKKYVSKKYGTDENAAPLLMVVGDGNHSLAAAKDAYEQLKKKLTPEVASTHPARYAMAELINIHTDAFEFEPIYRIVTGCDPKKLIEELQSETEPNGDGQKVHYYYNGGEGDAVFTDPAFAVTAGTLQRFIDNYIEDFGGRCDYIHGEEELKTLCAADDAVGFIFDGIAKDGLFRDIIKGGLLPRKSFSIGAADDKRFYLEMRRISIPVRLIPSKDAAVEAVVAYNCDLFTDFNMFHMNIRGRKKQKNILTSVIVVAIGIALTLFKTASAINTLGEGESFKFDFMSYVFPLLFIIIGALWLPIVNRMARKSLAMHWANQTQLHELVNIIRVSNEGIYVFTDNKIDEGEKYLEFDGVNKVYETPTAFYVYFTYNNAFIINKDDIEKGSVEDLRHIFSKKLGKKFSSKYTEKKEKY